MTTYYVSPPGFGGNDLSNGRGPDASHPTDRPWDSLAAALGAVSPVLPGDTIYLAPGFNGGHSALTIVASVASVANPTAIRGDPLNAQGFRDRSGVLLPPAASWYATRPVATGFDGEMTGSAVMFVTGTNDPSGLQFYDLVLDCGYLAVGIATVDFDGSTDWLFQDCRLIAGSILRMTPGTPTAGRNFTYRRCIVYANTLIDIGTATAAATPDADLNILVESCLIFARLTGNTNLGTAGGNLAGGIRFRGNTVYNTGNSSSALQTQAGAVSTVMPIRVGGNVIVAGLALNAATLGQIIDEGYNVLQTPGANVNVTQAATTKRNVAPVFDLPDVVKWGLGLPTESPLAWGLHSTNAQRHAGWPNTNPDFRGRTPRPWGAGAAIGYMEDATVIQDPSSAIAGGGAMSLAIPGAGEVSLRVPVDAVATTLTIITESQSYGGTSYPQIIMQANPQIGVAQTTATATDGTEQTLTIGPFTPTAAGVVELRLISRSTSLSGQTNFDVLQAA